MAAGRQAVARNRVVHGTHSNRGCAAIRGLGPQKRKYSRSSFRSETTPTTVTAPPCRHWPRRRRTALPPLMASTSLVSLSLDFVIHPTFAGVLEVAMRAGVARGTGRAPRAHDSPWPSNRQSLLPRRSSWSSAHVTYAGPQTEEAAPPRSLRCRDAHDARKWPSLTPLCTRLHAAGSKHRKQV